MTVVDYYLDYLVCADGEPESALVAVAIAQDSQVVNEELDLLVGKLIVPAHYQKMMVH
jgi:hypothetical protein